MISHDTADTKSLTRMPILCVEDGVVILKFSEIFGVSEPLKKARRRGHRHSVPKGNTVFPIINHLITDVLLCMG